MQPSQPPAASAPLAVLKGVLEHITYANEETGYTVARVATERGGDPVTVVGPLLGAQAGEHLHLEGRWRNHPLYGRQFEVRSYRAVLPATVQGIRRYLGSGLIRGIGPKMAERIVDTFGVDTLKVLEEDPGRLPPEQETAVRLALTERVAVLTGGPGCGKSFTVRAVVALARAKKARVLLAAPTGRAAKRLSELAGMDAQTLHRLLELRPGGEAAFNQDRPLDADLVVVDEASMLDLLLANKLVKAVPPGAHLLLVGDVDQLPSVGPGEVLRDLLNSGKRPTAGRAGRRAPGSSTSACSRSSPPACPASPSGASPAAPTGWATRSCRSATTTRRASSTARSGSSPPCRPRRASCGC